MTDVTSTTTTASIDLKKLLGSMLDATVVGVRLYARSFSIGIL